MCRLLPHLKYCACFDFILKISTFSGIAKKDQKNSTSFDFLAPQLFMILSRPSIHQSISYNRLICTGGVAGASLSYLFCKIWQIVAVQIQKDA